MGVRSATAYERAQRLQALRVRQSEVEQDEVVFHLLELLAASLGGLHGVGR